MSTTLVHIGVRTTDLEKSIRFWRDALGLRVFSTMNGCYDLTDGYHNFRVFQHRGPDRPEHVGGMLDYLHIGVRVPNLREAAQRCENLGFEITWEGLDGSKDLTIQIRTNCPQSLSRWKTRMASSLTSPSKTISGPVWTLTAKIESVIRSDISRRGSVPRHRHIYSSPPPNSPNRNR